MLRARFAWCFLPLKSVSSLDVNVHVDLNVKSSILLVVPPLVSLPFASLSFSHFAWCKFCMFTPNLEPVFKHTSTRWSLGWFSLVEAYVTVGRTSSDWLWSKEKQKKSLILPLVFVSFFRWFLVPLPLFTISERQELTGNRVNHWVKCHAFLCTIALTDDSLRTSDYLLMYQWIHCYTLYTPGARKTLKTLQKQAKGIFPTHHESHSLPLPSQFSLFHFLSFAWLYTIWSESLMQTPKYTEEGGNGLRHRQACDNGDWTRSSTRQ